MNNTKILALLPFLAKGALSLEILKAMPAKGLSVTVAYCEDISVHYPTDDIDDVVAGFHVVDLSRESVPGRCQVIGEVIRERDIDLVVQMGAADLYHHLARWKEAMPKLRIADVLYNHFGHTLNHFLYARCIDCVIVESEIMLEFVQCASLESVAVELVRSGVDLAQFMPREGTTGTGAPLTIGYIGRMSYEKDPMAFVDLAERLLRLDPDLEFRMWGSGPEAALIRHRLEASEAGQRILYAGFAEHAGAALHELDILVMPSRFDGRPAIIMEANACGIPVIAAPVGGVTELIEEGVNGFLAPPADTDAIYALLSAWKASPRSLAAIKETSRQHAVRNFDRERMLEDYALAFQRIASA